MRRFVLIVVIGITALWSATLPVLYWLLPGAGADATASRGQVGDAFGATNALFSGLALAGVIIAILLQREELRLQRRDLAETRKEMKRQADAAEKQEKALERQRRAQLLAAASAAVTGIVHANAGTFAGFTRDGCNKLLRELLDEVRAELGLPREQPPAPDSGVR